MKTVSGVVVDAKSGQPIPGANILVDDSDLGAAADEDGKFTIEGIEAGASLTASAIGFDSIQLFADSDDLSFQLSKI